MASSLFGVGITGLNSAQAGLLTTSHNISNVNTPGFSRQTVVQGTNNPQYTGVGFFGAGSNIQTIQRQYDQFLEVQARETQASASHLQRYATQIGRIDQLLGDVDAGLSSAIDSFFEGVHAVASHPADPAARQSMLSASGALVARFKSLDTQLTAARQDVNSQLQANVSAINSIAARIGELNERIATYSAQGNGVQQPNDLLDQRDTLVRDLNKLVRANVVEQDDGSYNVFIGSGQALVVRERANSLSVVDDLESLRDKQIALNIGNTQMRLRAGDLEGGELGGLLAYRDQTLNEAHNALGRMAMVLASEFNAQHNLGQDLNGAMGADYYAVGQPTWYGNSNNSATASINVTVADHGDLTTSDYRLRYDGSNYTLTRLPQNTSQTFAPAAMPVTVDGIQITVNAMNAGDSFLIQPTRNGANALAVLIHDTNAIAAASPIRTAASLNNAGNATISAGSVAAGFTAGTYNITFGGGGTTYTIDTAPPTTGAYTSGQAITFNGIEIAITGTPVDGDTFTVGPNTNGDSDNRNALALAGIQTRNVLAGDTATLQGGYAQLVASIGNKTREVQVTADAQAGMLRETLAARESISGVNLDEEAANLLRYQQAYQASGKVIAIAGTLFDSILEIMR
ncbi:MAG TPA: flagellar hook-associated protein FlgK [Burkholderiales bacterium]